MFARFAKWFARRTPVRRVPVFKPVIECLEDRRLMTVGGFLQTNLVSDLEGLAQLQDTSLVNPWGLVAGPTTPFWSSNNNAGVATLYTGQGAKVPLTVNIPAGPGSTMGRPTGIVFNDASTGGFEIPLGDGTTAPSRFIFDTFDGTIVGWTNKLADPHNAVQVVTTPGAEYTGLAIDSTTNGKFLYAANFKAGTIDVFDQNFAPVSMPGAFHDAELPTGYAPFNIQNINGKLYVEYAIFNPATGFDVAGKGHGFVDVFNADGVLLQRLIRHGQLDSPWGIALAPENFGRFSGDLLVGNFSDGHINAFDPNNGHFVGQMTDAAGKPIFIEHLWALSFGNGSAAGPKNTLFFTEGVQFGHHGLFGSLQAIPGTDADVSSQGTDLDAGIVSNLGNAAKQTLSTVPPNGDLNPYGVAFVPKGFQSGTGPLQASDILVSNFNNSQNLQGTGSTIELLGPNGQHSVFFQGQPGQMLGLTTALGVLKSGFVLVGNVPTADGTSATLEPTSLMILDAHGNVVENLSDPNFLNGPWDLTVHDEGHRAQVFVSNVLDGTVTRLDFTIPDGGMPELVSATRIASGYTIRTDPAALLVGPTGLAFDARRDILYVASTGDNEIFAIPHALERDSDAGMGNLVVHDDVHLHGPLGLALLPNGDLIATNGDAVNPDPNQPSEIVEFTRQGAFVSEMSLDPNAGAAFGIAVSTQNGALRIAAVDDATNTLQTFTFELNAEGLNTDDPDGHHHNPKNVM
jgi:uncharacterized protein (TIGR03118 family)